MKYNYIIILIFIFLYNCAAGPVGGFLFSYHKYSGEVNTEEVVPVIASSTGCQHSVLGLFSIGDAGAGSIANEKGIRRIATIDHSVLSILGFVYFRYCTIVNGATY